MRLDSVRGSGRNFAYRFDSRHIDTGRRYLVRWALVREEIGPGNVVPIAYLHRADALRLFELLLAMVQVFFYFLHAQVLNNIEKCLCRFFFIKK